jgi:hypothetical protein
MDNNANRSLNEQSLGSALAQSTPQEKYFEAAASLIALSSEKRTKHDKAAAGRVALSNRERVVQVSPDISQTLQVAPNENNKLSHYRALLNPVPR